jgi:hypothetical protein
LAAGAGDAVLASGVVPQLNVKFEGDIPADDFALLSEFMKDCVPAATSLNYGHGSQPTGPGGQMMIDNPRFVIGPVPDVEQLPGQITFGEASMIDGSTLRVRVRLPLPPRAESIRRRLQFALDGIRSDDVARQRNGMLLLESLEPLDRREEVATELIAIMSRPNSGVSASGALKKWGTPAQAAKLREMVAQEGTNTSELLDILASVSQDDAIRAAIDVIPREPGLAEGTLTRVGAASEPPAIEMLSHPESQVRLVACKVLLQIGTDASLSPLAPLERDADREVASYATRALAVIRERSHR